MLARKMRGQYQIVDGTNKLGKQMPSRETKREWRVVYVIEPGDARARTRRKTCITMFPWTREWGPISGSQPLRSCPYGRSALRIFP